MKENKPLNPPSWADRLLRLFCPPHLTEELLGDLHEQFEADLEQLGETRARRKYVVEVVRFAKPYFIRRRIRSVLAASFERTRQSTDYSKPLIFSKTMISNYLKVARRNLARQKSYTFINVFGLMLGMVCAILIFSLVSYHAGFDRFHSKADRVYRLNTEISDEIVNKMSPVPVPLGNAIRQDYSFMEKTARYVTFGGMISMDYAGKHLKFGEPEGVAYVEPEFFEIMDYPLVAGDAKTMLLKPNTAIITERLARKYFNNDDPVGKSFKVDNNTNFTVTGVLKDLPANTDIRQEVFLSYVTITQANAWVDTWGGIYGGSYAYVLLKPGISREKAEKSMAGLSKKYYNAREAKKFRFLLQPLSEVHLDEELGASISKNQLIALSLIGIFLIITACVNFINLATAQALSRAKEIGIRKVLGSIKGQLFWQFITETSVITTLGFLLAIAASYLALPYMNDLLQTRVELNLLRDYKQPAFLLLLLVVVVFVSGSYPGLILAGFQPIAALKGKLGREHTGGFSVRKGLVVFQFAISQTLLIGTIVVTSQMKYNSQTNLGFDKDAIVMLPVPATSVTKTNAMRARFSTLKGVEKVTFCNAPPSSYQNVAVTGFRYASRTEDESFHINFKSGDVGYLSAFNIPLVAGRNLVQSDTVREFLINEAAVKKLGLKSAQEVLGQRANINNRNGIIVGVMKDFHNESFRGKIEPLSLTTRSDNYFMCAVKLSGTNLPATLTSLEKVWNEINPEDIYSYQFLDEHLAGYYANDQLILQLMWFFASVAIFIGCLGLYGLVSFMVTQKTKEIGVRKVLGADVSSIIWLFGKQFTVLLLIAFVIAGPLGWWMMTQYLSDFQYRIKLDAGIFLMTIGISFGIAILTVGYRSVSAALLNPVRALRSE